MRNKRNSTDKKGINFSNVLKFTVAIVLIGISGLLFVNSARSVMTAYNRSLLLQQAEDEVNALRIENLKLTEKKDEMMEDSYVEEEARNRMIYVKDGEIVIVLPETGQESVLGEKEDDLNVYDNEGGWRRWWSLVKNGV